MKHVWVVERGEYSDYTVVGVFSSRKHAKVVADLINSQSANDYPARVSQWPLDPAIADLSAGRRPHLVYMLRDGTVERVQRKEVSGLAGDVRLWERSKAAAYAPGTPDCLWAEVWAKDEKHAVKIVNEIRARWVAEGKWK